MEISDLEGKEISKIYVSEDKEYIAFESEKSKELFTFVVEGYCCSRTWISNVYLVNNCLPMSVESVEILEPLIEEDIPGHECLKTYRIILKGKTTQDEVMIEFVNSSNGYYSGSIEFYNGVFEKKGATEYGSCKVKKIC